MTQRRERAWGLWRYLVLRGRFFIHASDAVVARHWQWFLFAGLLTPGLPVVSLFMVPAALFAQDLSAAHAFGWHFGVTLLFEAGALAWVLPQRRFLRGGAFRDYIGTLPISAIARCTVSSVLLFVVDILLFMPAVIGTGMAGHATIFDLACDIEKTLVFVAIILMIQLGIVERLPFLLLMGLPADIVFAAAASIADSTVAMLVLSGAVACALPCAAFAMRTERFCVGRAGQVGRLAGRLRPGLRLPAVWRVQFGILARNPVISAGCAVMSVAVPVGAGALIGAFDYDGRAPVAIVIGMAIVAFVLGNLYRLLADAHAMARPLFMTLPLSRHFWPIRDCCLVVGLGMVPLFMFGGILLAHRLVSLWALMGLAAGYVALLAVLRAVVGTDTRFRFMLAAAFSIAWAGAAIAGVSG
ncbi:hypothetical protein [Novacetimonas cocois]|uniref:hypothetical protein n=1 Tax=Novacetimonas cocois TaxID=1747507 RepID=UPI001057F132|nr:hypothetical protein [Novacetimonas cocois]